MWLGRPPLLSFFPGCLFSQNFQIPRKKVLSTHFPFLCSRPTLMDWPLTPKRALVPPEDQSTFFFFLCPRSPSYTFRTYRPNSRRGPILSPPSTRYSELSRSFSQLQTDRVIVRHPWHSFFLSHPQLSQIFPLPSVLFCCYSCTDS